MEPEPAGGGLRGRILEPWGIWEQTMSKPTSEQKWHQQLEDAKSAAESLPYGREREALERKASN
jgi:hypothetical protein